MAEPKPIVIGDDDSPVVALAKYMTAAIRAVGEAWQRHWLASADYDREV